jgi:hypothetical protein
VASFTAAAPRERHAVALAAALDDLLADIGGWRAPNQVDPERQLVARVLRRLGGRVPRRSPTAQAAVEFEEERQDALLDELTSVFSRRRRQVPPAPSRLDRDRHLRGRRFVWWSGGGVAAPPGCQASAESERRLEPSSPMSGRRRRSPRGSSLGPVLNTPRHCPRSRRHRASTFLQTARRGPLAGAWAVTTQTLAGDPPCITNPTTPALSRSCSDFAIRSVHFS